MLLASCSDRLGLGQSGAVEPACLVVTKETDLFFLGSYSC